jgi:hypothetical protein
MSLWKVCAILCGLISLSNAASGQVPRDRCDTTEKDSSLQYAKEDIKTESVPQLIKPKATFAPEAKIKCDLNWRIFSSEPIKQYQIEQGTKEGIPYDVYYVDGSGSIPNNPTNETDYLKEWHFHCEKDAIEDTKSCYVNYGSFFIWQYGDGSRMVHIGGNSYPGSEIVIRIDGGTPVRASEKTGFSKEQSRQIINALKSAKKVVTRWREWPSGSNKDEEWEIYNFPMVLERLDWTLKSIQ